MRKPYRFEDVKPALQRIVALYRVEITKALRLRQTYVGPLLLMLVVLLSPLAHPMAKDGVGDYGFIAYVTPMALNFLGYVLLLTYVGGLIATELGHGTLRAILLRPVCREEVYVAKFLLGCSYSALLTATVGITSWCVAFALGDLYGIQVGGELLFMNDEMAWTYFVGAFLALAPQWAGVSLGLLYSTLTRSAGTAVSLSIGTWIVLELIKYPLGIAPMVFTTYLEAPWHVFASHCDGLDASWFPMAFYCVLSSLVVTIVSVTFGLMLFRRKDLGSC
jgi:ABC-type transport system involved in multi-copper enzyme maturation permease subunit